MMDVDYCDPTFLEDSGPSVQDVCREIIFFAEEGDDHRVSAKFAQFERFDVLEYLAGENSDAERDLTQAHLMWSGGRRDDALAIIAAWAH